MPAGWYPDPSDEAVLRWWNGDAWTGSVHHSVAEPGARQSTPVYRLAILVGGGERIAVVDVETTGLYNVDRVVEVAVGTVNGDGTIEDEFETLINGLIDAAVEDSAVTDDEHDQLCRVAALLDIDIKHVARRTDSFRASTKAIELMAGLKRVLHRRGTRCERRSR
jgi:Protein of unknown function (DUF2510)